MFFDLAPFDVHTLVKEIHRDLLDTIIPIWNHPTFPSFPTNFIVSIVDVINGILEGEATKKDDKVRLVT